jgi:uncharacterized protein (TIGR03089 family)
MNDFYTALKKVVTDSGPNPAITWLSDAGRIELSNVTYANAVSKASNFLVDGLELDDQATVSVSLQNHWQSPVWLGSALATGVTIVESQATVAFGTCESAKAWQGAFDEFVAVSQHPFGMPDQDLPDGIINGSAEVRNFGDYFAPAWPVAADQAVVRSQLGDFTWNELKQHAKQLADQYHLELGKSYGLLGSLDVISSLVFQVVLPIAFRTPVVLIEQSTANLEDIKRQEKLEQIVMLD